MADWRTYKTDTLPIELSRPFENREPGFLLEKRVTHRGSTKESVESVREQSRQGKSIFEEEIKKE